MTAASSPALESAPTVTTAVSQSTGAWMLQGRGALICSTRGRLVAGVLTALGPSGIRLPRREHRVLGCVPAPCAPGPALLESRSQLRSPLRGASVRAPLSCSRVQPGAHCSPLGSSAAGVWRTVPGAQVSVSVPGSLRASLLSWVPAPTPCERLFVREGW